jgi:23S rRNA (uracil1939-C5)-methyltransferase
MQIDAKQSILAEVVRRALPQSDISLAPFLPSPQPYEYRNRIQLKASGRKLGFYESGTHTLIPIERCDIAEKAINVELQKLANDIQPDGQLRIQRSLDGIVRTIQIKKGEEPLGFAQVNSAQNELLQTKIIECYSGVAGAPVVDLYGGYGNFSLPLARKFKSAKIECVEWNKQAVSEGLKLGTKENLANLKFICGDVDEYLKRIRLPSDSFVIIDPPREGCSKQTMAELVGNKPKILIYISCDPMTWGRDVQHFFAFASEQGVRYRIATIHGLDMFPQTDHIEVFSVFERAE